LQESRIGEFFLFTVGRARRVSINAVQPSAGRQDMAVIVQYIVVRNGEQKMTFTSKKEADAYDRLLDIADHMYAFLEAARVDMSDDQLEDLSFYLAKNRDDAVSLLRGGKIKAKPAAAAAPAPAAPSKAAGGRKSAKNRKSQGQKTASPSPAAGGK